MTAVWSCNEVAIVRTESRLWGVRFPGGLVKIAGTGTMGEAIALFEAALSAS